MLETYEPKIVRPTAHPGIARPAAMNRSALRFCRTNHAPKATIPTR
jgi:hypothetical protein